MAYCLYGYGVHLGNSNRGEMLVLLCGQCLKYNDDVNITSSELLETLELVFFFFHVHLKYYLMR